MGLLEIAKEMRLKEEKIKKELKEIRMKEHKYLMEQVEEAIVRTGEYDVRNGHVKFKLYIEDFIEDPIINKLAGVNNSSNEEIVAVGLNRALNDFIDFDKFILVSKLYVKRDFCGKRYLSCEFNAKGCEEFWGESQSS